MTALEHIFYVGVDGGGTGCRARVEDASGRVIGEGIAGPASTRFGVEHSWREIEAAFSRAIAEAGLDQQTIGQIRAGVGVAGFNRQGAAEALRGMPHPFATLSFSSDATVACLGAHNGGNGGIVIVGTGSSGIGIVGGKEFTIGGYGFPISDEGSGADLGLRTIRESLRAHDGRQPHTALTRQMLDRFDKNPTNAVAWMDRATATDYATFAPMVLRHADLGDPVGRRIVQAASGHIDNIVRALIDAGAERVSLVGGLATVIQAWLAPDVRNRLADPIGDAVKGAIVLAQRAGRS